ALHGCASSSMVPEWPAESPDRSLGNVWRTPLRVPRCPEKSRKIRLFHQTWKTVGRIIPIARRMFHFALSPQSSLRFVRSVHLCRTNHVPPWQHPAHCHPSCLLPRPSCLVPPPSCLP